MATYSEFIPVVDLLGRALPNWPAVQPALRESFRESFSGSGVSVDDELELLDAIWGLRDLALRNGFGIVLDHNEGSLLNAQIADVIHDSVGQADDPQFRFYEHPDENISCGLEGFDRWLLHQNVSDLERTHKLRLVSIETGSDLIVSVVHPANRIDELIAAFASVGIRAHRHCEDTSPVPQIENYDTTAEYVAASLARNHGFDARLPLTVLRWVDDQNALFVTAKSEEPDTDVTVTAGLFRRDVFELEAELSERRFLGMFAPQLNEVDSDAMLIERPMHVGSKNQADVEEYLSVWMPQLLAVATLEFFDAWLVESGDDRHDLTAAFSRALSGTTTSHDDTWLSALFPIYPAWLTANPNGTR